MGQALRRLTFVLSCEKCGCRSLIRFSLAGNLTLPFHAGKAFMETAEANLSRSMQWLNTSYTVWFNRRHQRAGHLLQGRFKAVIVEAESWALGLSRYIHLNPVRLHRMGLDKAK